VSCWNRSRPSSGLQSLHLERNSVDGRLTTQFLADVALQHGGTLRHLRSGQHIYGDYSFYGSDNDQANLEVFFSHCTRLQTLHLQFEGPLDLPADLSSIPQLRSLTLWGCQDRNFDAGGVPDESTPMRISSLGVFQICAGWP